jgi:hypothetical protein
MISQYFTRGIVPLFCSDLYSKNAIVSHPRARETYPPQRSYVLCSLEGLSRESSWPSTENQAEDHEYKTHSSDAENSGRAQSRRKAFQEVSHLFFVSRDLSYDELWGVLNVSGKGGSVHVLQPIAQCRDPRLR